jgi:creatinine amidohydrolase
MPYSARPYVLAEVSWKAVKETTYQVAVLPWGATEPHNYHLPYATDIIETDHITAEAARIAWERGAKVIVLPTIPFGVNSGQLDLPLTINMNPSTQAAVLEDVAASLTHQGIRKLVIVNGHGGNDFKQMVRELQARHPRLFACTVNWYQIVDRALFSHPGDHADEMETSLMLHLAPHLVRPLSEAGTGAAREFKLAALREKWAWAPRFWPSVTDDTGAGDPRAANAAKGAEYLKLVTERLAGFFVELAAADPDHLYV